METRTFCLYLNYKQIKYCGLLFNQMRRTLFVFEESVKLKPREEIGITLLASVQITGCEKLKRVV